MSGWPTLKTTAALRTFAGGLRQIASVRRITLEDGPERGVAAIAFSTGGGLDFWALADRAMDIGPLWLKGAQIAWQGPAGFVHPSLVDAEDHGGRGFERAFSGFLQSCGLEHNRQPAAGYPLHGRLPFLPARVIAAGENWDAETPHLYCEAEIVQWRLAAESLRLVRRIEAPIGGTELVIRDRVENRGPAPQRCALLYHFNLGFPFIAPGTIVTVNGRTEFGPLKPPDATILPVVKGADAVGETGVCRMFNPDDPAAPGMTVEFSADTLPHLQIWHDARPSTYVLAVEPCTAPRVPYGELADEPILAPGESRAFSVRIAFAAGG
jgi:hypothetical protein